MTKYNSERNKIMRLLHTMLRVGNLERSLDFYQNVLNMQLLRRRDYPEAVLLWLLSAMAMRQTILFWN